MLLLSRRPARVRVAPLISFVLLLVFAGTASATTRTWVGGASGLWATASNWSPAGTPSTGDFLVFPANGATATLTNDLDTGTELQQLGINGSYILDGNPITLTGGVSGSGTASQLSMPIRIQGNQTFSVTNAIYSLIDVNGFTLTGAPGSSYSTLLGGGTLLSGANSTFTGSSPFSGTIYLGGQTTMNATMPNLAAITQQSGVNATLGLSGSYGSASVNVNSVDIQGATTIGSITANLSVSAPLTAGAIVSATIPSWSTITASSITTSLVNFQSYFGTPLTATTGSYHGGIGTTINGGLAGEHYGRIDVNGGVDVTNTPLVLALSNSFVPVADQEFVLISNDGADPVVGTFQGVPEATTITLNGAHQFKLSYAGGDGNDVTLKSLNGRQAPTVTITSSQNPTAPGQNVTFTATVGGPLGNGTGTVKFYVDSVPYSTKTLASGQASFSTTSLTQGTHQVRVDFGGDLNYGGTSSSVTQNATLTATTTALSAPPSAPFGTTVNLTATVSPSTATGSITFKDGTTPLATVNLTSGSASYSTSALATGTHSLTATYNGDSSYGGSTSDVSSVQITQIATTVTLVSSANPAIKGQPVTFTASVSPSAATGNVSFIDTSNGNSVLASVALSGGSAALTTTTLSAGSHGLVATYDGSTNYAGSSSGALQQVISVKGDFSGDAQPDILLRNYSTGADAIWTIQNGQLASIVDLPTLANTSFRFEGTADFNGDGKTDIVIRNYSTGANAIWLMNGTQFSSIVDLPTLPNANYRFQGTGDFNNDGKPDIVIRNYTNGANALWLMNGTAYVSTVDLPALPNTDYVIIGTADFSGDGRPDIVLRNYANGLNAFWVTNGTSLTSIVDLPQLANTAYKFGGLADFNADGKTDIILRNQTTGVNAVWLMNGTTLSSVLDLPALPNTAYEFCGPR